MKIYTLQIIIYYYFYLVSTHQNAVLTNKLVTLDAPARDNSIFRAICALFLLLRFLVLLVCTRTVILIDYFREEPILYQAVRLSRYIANLANDHVTLHCNK